MSNNKFYFEFKKTTSKIYDFFFISSSKKITITIVRTWFAPKTQKKGQWPKKPKTINF